MTADFIAGCVLCLQAAAFGGERMRDHDIVPEDYFTIGVITSCRVSPDARYVAYTEMRSGPPAEKRNTDLWMVETGTKVVRPLTLDPPGDADIGKIAGRRRRTASTVTASFPESFA